MNNELVFVIEEELIENISELKSVEKSISSGHFLNREVAEKDENYKQIIPYVMVKNQDGKYLAYRRSDKSGENRLHGKWSVGFGGHINPDDIPSGSAVDFDSFLFAINRELTEELCWGNLLMGMAPADAIDIIYDPSNEVGRVHLGVLYELDINLYNGCVWPQIAENAIGEIRWMSKEEVLNKKNLENWSKIALSRV